MQYYFPAGLSPATVEQRARFYREEFPTEEVRRRMERWPQFVPIIDVGTETTRYRPRHKKMKGRLVRLDVETADELREKLIEYAPEDVYYDRTLAKPDRVEVNPEQELVFSLRASEVPSDRIEQIRDRMPEKWHEYVFTLDAFEAIASQTRKLHTFLERHFDDLRIVFEGTGFNIHVEDPSAYRMHMEDRRELARKVYDRFQIDKAVTGGETDMTRLPGSLNGLVSRKAIDVSPGTLTDPEDILENAAKPVSFLLSLFHVDV